MVARESTDVVIVGAGIAGLSLALGLARHGMKVTIVEAGSQPATPSLEPVLTPICWSGTGRARVVSLFLQHL